MTFLADHEETFSSAFHLGITPSRMEMENRTVVSEFILLGIPNTKGKETILFISFLAFYLWTRLGNLLILSAILADSRLHTPMYFFLCTLSVLDIGFASISTPNCCLTFTLSYCGPNVVDYFFCDVFPMVKLTCVDTYVTETVSFTNIGMVPMTCFLLIFMSYIRIADSVVRMRSAERRRKAVSTCASHLTVVCFFFGPCALLYSQPSLSNVLATPTQIFCNVVTPMLNLAIYTLRNKEVKAAFRKMKGG
ncbi:olfactory receptor 10D3-like [Emydura macquarii macquarii]|uniref:olfactory receptor 10D3-like n=1 Tax=Emydura macquarii macquarii TaxID=1129001 RepID=UPI00352A4A6D